MKTIIFTLIFFCASISACPSTQQSFSDLYLFNKLLDCPTVSSMIQTCENHGLIKTNKNNGYYNFLSSTGTEFRCKIDKELNGMNVPVIEVITKTSLKDLDNLLSSIGYERDKKNRNIYYKGAEYTLSRTICTLKENKKEKTVTMFFTKIYNRQEKDNV